ncbi:MAG: hypothetical protein ABDH21_03040 [bacterium]
MDTITLILITIAVLVFLTLITVLLTNFFNSLNAKIDKILSTTEELNQTLRKVQEIIETTKPTLYNIQEITSNLKKISTSVYEITSDIEYITKRGKYSVQTMEKLGLQGINKITEFIKKMVTSKDQGGKV